MLLIALPAYVLLVDRWGDLPTGWRATAAMAFFLTSFMIFDLLRRTLYMQLMQLAGVSVGAVPWPLACSVAMASIRVSDGASRLCLSDMSGRLRLWSCSHWL